MGKQAILLVEDNEDDIFALKRAFRQQKIDNPLMVVTDGQAAIDYLAGTGRYADREMYPMPFVVFLDLKLPYLNGFDVLAWIRQQPDLASLVVVVLTSSDETRDYQKAYQLGVRSYLVKPTPPEDVRKFLDSMAGWNRPVESGPVVVKVSTGMSLAP